MRPAYPPRRKNYALKSTPPQKGLYIFSTVVKGIRQHFSFCGRGRVMPEVTQPAPRLFGLFKRRRTPSLSRLPVKDLRPLNVDVPDVVLPRRYRRHGVVLTGLSLGMEKLGAMESPSTPRPCSEFPLRAGQAVYVGRRTPRFYLTALRNLFNKFLRRPRSYTSVQYTKRRRHLVLDIVRDWLGRRRKSGWVEPRRHDGRDLKLFYVIFNMIDKRFKGARIRYREEKTSSCVYYRVKFEHYRRGGVEVLERDLYSAVKEMQYELEFEYATRYDAQFTELFQILDMKYPGARVMYKEDKYGRKHVKVDHAVCGFRTCGRTTEEAIGILLNLYGNNIAARTDRKMKRWTGIFDAMEDFYPGSRLVYNQVSRDSWHAKIVHEVEDVIATGRSCTLEFTLAQLRSDLERCIVHLRGTRGCVRRWGC